MSSQYIGLGFVCLLSVTYLLVQNRVEPEDFTLRPNPAMPKARVNTHGETQARSSGTYPNGDA